MPVGSRADDLLIRRERFVTDDLQEHVVVTNLTGDALTVELTVELASDFADILSIKHHDFALGDPGLAEALPPPVELFAGATPQTAHLLDPEGVLSTEVRSSRAALVSGSALAFALELGPHAEWDVRLTFRPRHRARATWAHALAPATSASSGPASSARCSAWNMRVPQLRASWPELGQAYARSVSDLAALRMRGSDGVGLLPAAGMPWFMTVFGRDTVITCLQTLVFGPELAHTALRVLAELQAEHDDPEHRRRAGQDHPRAAPRASRRGLVPALLRQRRSTPLFLVLLSETWRWTADDALVRELEPAMRMALRWIDESGDRDGDGFVEFLRRSEHGLAVQSWKDSPDSQRFADGRIAAGRRRGQRGAGLRLRRQAPLRGARAGGARATRLLAERLERDADELRERFDRAFWVERSGGFYALALDGGKQPVDSRCSNMGHLLWSGIVPDARVGDVARTLLGAPLWSGWGVRTMSAEDEAYRPLAYHNGTVWPHDNSLIAHGLSLRGESDAALRILRSMLEAARFFDGGLPEVFAGLPRRDTPFPVAYPTASRPQAWAAGAPVLLLRVLLGLEPDPVERTLAVRTGACRDGPEA